MKKIILFFCVAGCIIEPAESEKIPIANNNGTVSPGNIRVETDPHRYLMHGRKSETRPLQWDYTTINYLMLACAEQGIINPFLPSNSAFIDIPDYDEKSYFQKWFKSAHCLIIYSSASSGTPSEKKLEFTIADGRQQSVVFSIDSSRVFKYRYVSDAGNIISQVDSFFMSDTLKSYNNWYFFYNKLDKIDSMCRFTPGARNVDLYTYGTNDLIKNISHYGYPLSNPLILSSDYSYYPDNRLSEVIDIYTTPFFKNSKINYSYPNDTSIIKTYSIWNSNSNSFEKSDQFIFTYTNGSLQDIEWYNDTGQLVSSQYFEYNAGQSVSKSILIKKSAEGKYERTDTVITAISYTPDNLISKILVEGSDTETYAFAWSDVDVPIGIAAHHPAGSSLTARLQNGMLELRWMGSDRFVTYTLITIAGKTVAAGNMIRKNKVFSASVDCSHLAKGIYLVRAINSAGMAGSEKIVIK